VLHLELVGPGPTPDHRRGFFGLSSPRAATKAAKAAKAAAKAAGTGAPAASDGKQGGKQESSSSSNGGGGGGALEASAAPFSDDVWRNGGALAARDCVVGCLRELVREVRATQFTVDVFSGAPVRRVAARRALRLVEARDLHP